MNNFNLDIYMEMNTLISKITINDIAKFDRLAPSDILFGTRHKDIETFVLSVKDKEDYNPVGLIQFSKSGKNYVLLWIYVLEEYRNNGFGKALLKFMADTGKKDGITDIEVEIFKDYFADGSTEEMALFLSKQGYENYIKKVRTWILTGKDFFANKYISKEDDSIKGVTSFSECTYETVTEALRIFGITDVDIAIDANRKFSFLYEARGSYEGIVVSRRTGKTFYPRFFLRDENIDQDAFFRGIFLGIARQMRFSYKLIIRDSYETGAWIEKTFPSVQVTDSVLMLKKI